MMQHRMPAEWEPQSEVMLSFPRRDGDWGELCLPTAIQHFDLVLTVARYVPVLLVVDDMKLFSEVLEGKDEAFLLQGGHSDSEPPFLATPAGYRRIRIFPATADDVWARDFGPITVERNGRLSLLDFTFNGWGNKFPADRDNTLTRRLHAAGYFGELPLETIDFVLEGGSIESDGRGTLLTTSQCLLSPERNPEMDQAEITALLKRYLGVDRVLYLDHGHLEGDDTDAHVDTLARFTDPETIVYQGCDDPTDPHYDSFQRMAEQLRTFRTREDHPYRLLSLPWHPPVFSREDGRRLPATYANFLITNGAVLVPVTKVPTDARALAVIAGAFPGREIVPVSADLFVEQHGSVHCLTMQLF